MLSTTWIWGSTGNDTLYGTTGNDTITAFAGDDLIRAGNGDDTVLPGLGDDSVGGGNGFDLLSYWGTPGGGVTVDIDGGTVSGAAGSDTFAGFESFRTTRSDDIIFASDDDDTVDGADGYDVIDYSTASGGVTVDLTRTDRQETGGSGSDELLNIESVVGSIYDDVFLFGQGQAGDSFTVSGGGGANNIIDLTGFSVDDATITSTAITLNLGGGTMEIQYSAIASMEFADGTVDGSTLAVDQGPTADAGIDTVANEGDRVQLQGANSTDANGDPLSYSWVQISGPSVTLDDPTAASPSFTAPNLQATETIVFELTVSDGSETSSATVAVEVTADADRPIADPGPNQAVAEGTLVQLDATGSVDPEGVDLQYGWIQVSGPPVTLSDANAAQPTFTAPEQLTNTTIQFELIVTDGFYRSDAEVVTITVNADNDAPTANAGSSQTVNEGDLVSLDASASIDPEGQSLTYTWVQTSGPSVTLSDPHAAQPTFTAPDTGANTQVTFELSVSDGSWTSSVDTITVQIGTWTEGDRNDNTVYGTDADDRIRTFEGDDDIYSANGNDEIDGGSGWDKVDYTFASGAITIDLSDTTWQNTGGAGTDRLTNIERIVGSNFDDTFQLKSPTAGSMYEFIGNGGNNTLELSSVDSSDVVFGDGVLTVDLGGGESFQIFYGEVGTIEFGDVTATVLDGDSSIDTFSGHEIWIYDGTAIEIELTGSGTAFVQFASETNTLAIVGTAGTDSATELIVDDLGSAGATISANITSDLRLFESSVDVGNLALNGSTVDVAEITIGNGSGTIAAFVDNSPRVDSPMQINASIGSMTVNGQILDSLGVSGNVGSFAAQEVAGEVSFGGNVVSVSTGDISRDFEVDGNVGNFNAQHVSTDIVIHGDLDNLTVSSVAAGETIRAERVMGFASFNVNGVNTGQSVVTVSIAEFNGTSQAWSISSVAEAAPVASSGPNQTVDEGDSVALNGTASSDANLDPLTFAWTQVSGPSVTLDDPSSDTPTFTAPELLSNTDIQFQLTVTDIGGLSDSSTVSITVNADNDAPSADAGANITAHEGETVTLNASGSVDPENAGLTYAWQQVSGPSVVLDDSSAAQPNFTAPEGLANTTVRFELTVSDGTQTSSVDTVDITIQAENDAPTADAGQAAAYDEGSTVRLNGTASSDPEGVGLTYSWTQVSGPSVTLDDPNSAQPSFTSPNGLANTNLQFALTVSDGANVSSVDTVTITIFSDNDAPTADAGSPIVADELDVVTLQGLGSSDPEGQGLTYSWIQVSGPTVTLTNPNSATPSFTAPQSLSNTTLQFELTVSDGSNVSSAATVSVLSQADNDAPSANAGSNIDASEGTEIELNGTASIDPEGEGLTYTWIQTGGPTVTLDDPTSATPRLTVPEAIANTTIEFELQVSDGTSTSSADTVRIAVAADNDAPSADAGPPQVSAESELIQLDGTASSDPEGQGLTYTWTQTQGPTVTLSDPTSATPTFTVPEQITNTIVRFELTVSDGATASSDEVSVGIRADNDAPSVNAGRNQSVQINETVELRAFGRDPEGQALTYTWVQTGGPSVELQNSDTGVPNFVAPEVTESTPFEFQVAASDGTNTSFDSVTILVTQNEAPNEAPSVAIVGVTNVIAGEEVLIGASASDPEGDTLTYQWSQVSGPIVALPNSTQPTLRFESPESSSSIELTFQVEVSDGNQSTTSIVVVSVAPSPASSAGNAASSDASVSSAAPNTATPTSATDAASNTLPQANATSSANGTAPEAGSSTNGSLVSGLSSELIEGVLGSLDPTGTTNTPVSLGTLAGTSTDQSSLDIASVRPATTDAEQSETLGESEEPFEFDSGRQATLEDESGVFGNGTRSLLQASTLEAEGTAANDNSELVTRLAPTDLVVATAGEQLRLKPTALAAATANTVEEVDANSVRFRQIAGTEIELADADGNGLLVVTPEVFLEEEIVFEVEFVVGNERIVQEVALQVQPVGLTNRSLAIDDYARDTTPDAREGDEQPTRGLGRIWGALLAFFGAQASRRKN
ncbi:MAG: REJ domain-containing protein [Planctomycetota bacterium]